MWSTAPFLLNNSVGPFESSPTVEARMKSFQASIEEMLWPERREQDSNDDVARRVLIERGGRMVRGPSRIDRVGDRLESSTYGGSASATPAYLTASAGFLPSFLEGLVAIGAQIMPARYSGNTIRLGPIPAGTPIGLLSNLILLPESKERQTGRRTAATW